MEECQQIFVMSKFWLATKILLTIPFMEGYFEDQVQPDLAYMIQTLLEVIDRTTERWFRLRNGLSMKKNNTITIEGTLSFP